MTKAVILKRLNDYTANYLKAGWLIDYGNSAGFSEFSVNLTKDGERIKIYGEARCNGADDATSDTFVLAGCKLDLSRWVAKKAEPLFEEVLYKVGKNWYIKNLDMANEAYALHYKRLKSRRIEPKNIKPSKKLAEMLSRGSFKYSGAVKAERLKISTFNGGYEVKLFARSGTMKDAVHIHFPRG